MTRITWSSSQAPKDEKSKKSQTTSGSNAKTLVKYFANTYESKFGLPYPVAWGKHCSLVKRLMVSYTPDTIRRFFLLHLNSKDPFVVKAGHSLETLICKVPSYVANIAACTERRNSIVSKDFERIKNS